MFFGSALIRFTDRQSLQSERPFLCHSGSIHCCWSDDSRFVARTSFATAVCDSAVHEKVLFTAIPSKILKCSSAHKNLDEPDANTLKGLLLFELTNINQDLNICELHQQEAFFYAFTSRVSFLLDSQQEIMHWLLLAFLAWWRRANCVGRGREKFTKNDQTKFALVVQQKTCFQKLLLLI